MRPENKCRLEVKERKYILQSEGRKEEVNLVQGCQVSHWDQRMIAGGKCLDRRVDVCRREVLVC